MSHITAIALNLESKAKEQLKRVALFGNTVSSMSGSIDAFLRAGITAGYVTPDAMADFQSACRCCIQHANVKHEPERQDALYLQTRATADVAEADAIMEQHSLCPSNRASLLDEYFALGEAYKSDALSLVDEMAETLRWVATTEANLKTQYQGLTECLLHYAPRDARFEKIMEQHQAVARKFVL